MNPIASRNIKFISHSDLGGRGDGVQVMVHRGFAYIGHGFSNGITHPRRARRQATEARRFHRLPSGHARLSFTDT